MGTMKKLGTITGLAAAAAGAYYFYYSKNAKKNRKAAKEWMESAKEEVVSEVRKLKDAALNEENYKRIVAGVTEKYRKLRKLGARETKDFMSALGSGWKQFQKDLSKRRAKTTD